MNRKVFRIVPVEVSETLRDNPNVFRWKVEQRHTSLCFLHWFGTPSYAPPHLFVTKEEAIADIRNRYKNAIIYELIKA